MSPVAEDRLVALLLTNRLTEVEVAPLRAAEYWPLLEQVPDPGDLLGATEGELTERVGDAALAERIARLLDASVAVAFACERLDEAGIRVLTSFDGEFPGRLVERLDEAGVRVLTSFDAEFPARLVGRLGRRCPPFLLAAGPAAVAGGIGVAGLREPSADAAAVATMAGERIVSLGDRVVTGLSPGVDRLAMDAALALGGAATVIPAEGLGLVGRRADTRSLVLGGRVTMLSPFGPETLRTTVTARGRNRVVYGLADLTLVVASDGDTDTTFHGASEALDHGDGPVVAWVGAGCGPTNPSLVERGARPLADLAVLR